MSLKVPLGCTPPSFGVNAIQGILNKRMGDDLEGILGGGKKKKSRKSSSRKADGIEVGVGVGDDGVGDLENGGGVRKESRRGKGRRRERERNEARLASGLRESQRGTTGVPFELPGLSVGAVQPTVMLEADSRVIHGEMDSVVPRPSSSGPLTTTTNSTDVLRDTTPICALPVSTLDSRAPSFPEQRAPPPPIPGQLASPSPITKSLASDTVVAPLFAKAIIAPPVIPSSNEAVLLPPLIAPSAETSTSSKPKQPIPAWAIRMACIRAAEKRRAASQALLVTNTNTSASTSGSTLVPNEQPVLRPVMSLLVETPQPVNQDRSDLTTPPRGGLASSSILIPETPSPMSTGKTMSPRSPTRLKEWTRKVDLAKLRGTAQMDVGSSKPEVEFEPKQTERQRPRVVIMTAPPSSPPAELTPPSSPLARVIPSSSPVRVMTPPPSSPQRYITPPPCSQMVKKTILSPSSPSPIQPAVLDKTSRPEPPVLNTDALQVLVKAATQPLQNQITNLETLLLRQSQQLATILESISNHSEAHSTTLANLVAQITANTEVINEIRPAMEEMYARLEEVGDEQGEGFENVRKGIKGLSGDGKKRFEEIMKGLGVGGEMLAVRRNWAGRIMQG